MTTVDTTELDPAIDIASFRAGGVNTRLSYRYRDADNFKQYEEVVLPGALTLHHACALVAGTDALDGFVPSAVGLKDLQVRSADGWQPDKDHPFHEIERVALVDRAPTTMLGAEQFLALFLAADWAIEADRVMTMRGCVEDLRPSGSTDAARLPP